MQRKGFFSLSEAVSEKPMSGLSTCGSCGLARKCRSPKMNTTGLGKKKILIIGGCPTSGDDEMGISFSGKSGKFLKKNLNKLGVDLDRDCWRTFAVTCHSPSRPDDKQIESCRSNLIKTIKELQPNAIIPLGQTAIQSLISWAWKDDPGTDGKWAGFLIPNRKPNTWIAPNYSITDLIKFNNDMKDQYFRIYLKKAIKKAKKKPWGSLPVEATNVRCICKPSKAAKVIKALSKNTKTIAFDYETNCIKPEYKGAEIVSCSICFDGKDTLAFPFENEAIDATATLLQNPKVSKIASNLKFEDRWTKKVLGFHVKNWVWDTMLAAHVLDNRPGITSVKFQSYVLLGAGSYDNHISPFLKSDSYLNRIREIDIKDLLLYNGLDSILEYKVAMKQMKQMKA